MILASDSWLPDSDSVGDSILPPTEQSVTANSLHVSGTESRQDSTDVLGSPGPHYNRSVGWRGKLRSFGAERDIPRGRTESTA